MHHVMFDIDGTLVESYEFDEKCYINAIFQVLGHNIDSDWTNYHHISDAGILDQHLQKHNLLYQREYIHAQVKSAFINNIKEHLIQYSAKEVPGAAEFITFLSKQNNVSLSIATGGWAETAQLKLASAGINVGSISIASSNDHYSRTEIMKFALNRAAVPPGYNLTYFGDAAWDKRACEDLQFNFVLVGNKIKHRQTIKDFTESKLACSFIGL